MYVQNDTIKLMQKELGQKNKSLILEYIKDECFNKNSNFIGLWVGKPGIGKSVSALRTCEKLDPSFQIDQVVFSIDQLLSLILKFQEMMEKGIDIRGKAILYDEAGITADNREWQSQVHKALNDSIETFRFLNLVLMITVPGKNRIDSKIRELIHGTFYPTKKARDHRIVKFMLHKYDIIKEKEYSQYLRIQSHGWIAQIRTIKVFKPSRLLLNAYEKRMQMYKKRINIQSHQRVSGINEKIFDDRKPLTDRQKQIYDLKRKNLKNKKISELLNISSVAVSKHLSAIRYKGYDDV